MTKTIEQLQAALNREIESSTGLNWKIDKMREQLKNYISKEEHLLPTIHLHGLDKLLRERYDLITAEKAVPKEV